MQAMPDVPDEVQFLELSLAPEDEAKQPPFANYVNVNGAGDTLTLDFFYLHPDKEARLFEGSHDGAQRKEEDGVVSVAYALPPAARVVVPVRVALDLIADMLEEAMDTLPLLQGALQNFSERMTKLSARSQSLAAPSAPSTSASPSPGSSHG